jgi:hypothetical protein
MYITIWLNHLPSTMQGWHFAVTAGEMSFLKSKIMTPKTFVDCANA